MGGLLAAESTTKVINRISANRVLDIFRQPFFGGGVNRATSPVRAGTQLGPLGTIQNSVFQPNYLPFVSFQSPDEAIRRAPITQWFYNPLFGQPRGVDIAELKSWAGMEYTRIVIDTIINEITCLPWAIVPKEGRDPTDEQKLVVEQFFTHPNSNGESLSSILKQYLRDLLELDAGVIVKNFNFQGDMEEIVARDGGAFLKNYDYTGFAPGPEDVDASGRRIPAYYMYSFVVPDARPIPFLVEEIVYTMLYPRSDTVYGFSVIESIKDRVIKYLFRSGTWNASFFERNAVPPGMIVTKGMSPDNEERIRQFWSQKATGNDHKVPLINTEAMGGAEFISFGITNRDMDFIKGQQWFANIVFSAFKLNPNELGFTGEIGSKNIGESQERITIRKAIKPIIDSIEWAFNNEIVPEFFKLPDEETITRDTIARTNVEFTFILEDTMEQEQQLSRDKIELESGLTTINEIRIRQGKEEVAWGDTPLQTARQFDLPSFEGFSHKDEEYNKSNEQYDFVSKKFIPRKAPFDEKRTQSFLMNKEKELNIIMNKAIIEINKKVMAEVKARKKEKSLKTKGLEDNFKALLDNISIIISTTLDKFNPSLRAKASEVWEAGVVNAEKTLDMNITKSADTRDIIQVATQNTLELVNNDLQDYKKRISLIITEGITNQQGITEISKNIREAAKTTKSRAQAIARTETNRIFNQAHLNAYKDSDVVVGKEWVTAADDRVRPSHAKLNGKKLSLEGKFSIQGEKLLAPPAGVNCRCSIVPILEGEKI